MTDYYSRCGAEDAEAEARAEQAAEEGRWVSRDNLRAAIRSRQRCECLNPSWWWGSVFAPFDAIPGLPESATLEGVCMSCKGHAVRFSGTHHLVWSQWAALDTARLKLTRLWCRKCDRACRCPDKELIVKQSIPDVLIGYERRNA